MYLSKTNRTNRNGITIIEVLTSIVVAMIGVFGVMIMIPFAVKQAQSGLDNDAATNIARNAYDQFEIRGYRIAVDNPTTGVRELNWTINGTRLSAENPDVYCIDPLGFTEGGTTTFPFPTGSVPMPPPVLPTGGAFLNAGNQNSLSANLMLPGNAPMGIAEARNMFRGMDDLVFDEPISVSGIDPQLLGPAQVFDGGTLRRQSGGQLSWCAIVVPTKDDFFSNNTEGWKYRMYILVFKNRPTLMTDPTGTMFAQPLQRASNVGLASPLGTVFFNSGVIVEDTPLEKDDWVMLINRAETDDTVAGFPSGVQPAEPGFERQIAFARVVGFANENGVNLPSITLDGPDFNFGDETAPDNIIGDTYIVHLRNCVGVYERSFVPEGESNWNVSF